MEENPFANIEEYIEYANAIVPPAVGAATFKVEHGLIFMLKAEGGLRNSTVDDPTQHLRNFLGVCAMQWRNNVFDDALRLRCFKYSLAGDARKWLQNMPPNSIHSWPELVRAFLAKWFPKNMQMRDLSREQNPKQKGTLPSDTIANPKGSGSGPTSHVMAITTRSGKVLEGGSEQAVEFEESEQEAEVEEPSVVEVERVPEELKVQEENREEVKEKVKETSKTLPSIPRHPPPFPQRLSRKVDNSKLEKIYDILKQLSVNIPIVEAFQEKPCFAKYLNDLITKKRTIKNEVKEDPGAFTIPYTIGAHDFARALCDNGASINLMPLAIYKQPGLGMPRPTNMRLQMADRSIKRPVRIVDDVLVKVGKFHLPANFIILDFVVDKKIPIILGRPFLATGRALMVSERNEIKFRVNDEEVTFQASKGMKLPHEIESISVIDVVDEVEDAVEIKMEEQCLGEALAAIW
ncbi:uncharacterized protein [Nicotiana sylvestris]|uniref:uncharacterized protein n=1 Tax=Nicotiana sylvestris TaxID=4096 RepID=UPI00388CB7A0